MERLLDLGSGNGFPGVVFGILYSTVNVVLVDRDIRKAEYLKTVISELKLTNLRVEVRSADGFPEKSLGNALGDLPS